jgi:hypothetical protein
MLKTNLTTKVISFFTVVLLFAGFNTHNLYAMFWSAPGATVWLKGCKSDDCALHGTLRAIPFTNGEWEITSQDGAVTKFTEKNYRQMSLPYGKTSFANK